MLGVAGCSVRAESFACGRYKRSCDTRVGRAGSYRGRLPWAFPSIGLPFDWKFRLTSHLEHKACDQAPHREAAWRSARGCSASAGGGRRRSPHRWRRAVHGASLFIRSLRMVPSAAPGCAAQQVTRCGPGAGGAGGRAAAGRPAAGRERVGAGRRGCWPPAGPRVPRPGRARARHRGGAAGCWPAELRDGGGAAASRGGGRRPERAAGRGRPRAPRRPCA